jgi:hypothetical protein
MTWQANIEGSDGMRAEITQVSSDIEQGLALLRRHL